MISLRHSAVSAPSTVSNRQHWHVVPSEPAVGGHDGEPFDLGLGYLSQGTIEQYAQVLLSSNEEIFWQ